MSATDELRRLLDERGVEYETDDRNGLRETIWCGTAVFQLSPTAKMTMIVTPEQAIAATLGRPKAKAHPYGYEPDTGAFDCTRCECGCINDISAKYCNDCGGEIEIDMYAEKEIYHCPRHLVFAEKHDDGSLEFDGKRYIAATLGSGTLTAEQVEKAIHDCSTYASYDGCTYYASGIRLQAIADELNATLGGGECKWVWVESWTDTTDGRECDYAHWMPDCGCWSEGDYRFSDFDDYEEKPTGIVFCERCGKAVKR